MHPPDFAGQVRIARTMHPRGHPVRADGKRPPDGTRTPGHLHANGAMVGFAIPMLGQEPQRRRMPKQRASKA